MNYRLPFLANCCLSLLLLCLVLPASASAQKSPDPQRIEQLAKMLPAEPAGVGRPIGDRQTWQAIAGAPGFKDVVRRAEELMKQPIPELTDELFLDFSRTGNRTRCQRVLRQRQGRIPRLVLAECIENRGRFLAAIEASIRAVCSEKTWVMPAHDRALNNFRGRVIEIDLAVIRVSWNMATADYWLGDKLSAKTRKLIRDELERRTFGPYQRSVKTGKPRLWWRNGTNNWNAVCLAGVTGSALAMIESPQRRAFFIAAAENDVKNFLRGFTSDGYCSEGVGYWNYGFGHYALLAETIFQATGGKVDMFDSPAIERIARFGRRMEITPGVYPAFADCSTNSRPSGPLTALLSRRFGLGMKAVESRYLLLGVGPVGSLFELGIYGSPNSATAVSSAAETPLPPRDWFPEAGILVCRPAADAASAMGVALKGGNNAEHHNHNDVGSFLVVLGKSVPLIDPGAEVYTRRTFSSRRYESDVLNSFGHPVPRVAGKLQRTGRSAAGKVLETEFTDAADTVAFDISSAYDVKGLKKLTRTFVFSRQGRGSLSVVDRVEFDRPEDFSTALITFCKWSRDGQSGLVVGDGKDKVRVEIDTGAEPFELKPVTIDEDVRADRQPVRLGIELKKPVESATVSLKIVPAN